MAQSAKDILRSALAQWGLDSIADQVWGNLTESSSADEIVTKIRESDAYKQRFAGNLDRQRQGYTPLSEAEYLAYETQARQLMRANGLPAGFYDQPDDFVRLIGQDVSLNELSSRVTAAKNFAGDTPEAKAEAARLYGITDGQLAAYVLDPERALPLIQRQIDAARAAGAAQRVGFDQLSATQAERVASLTDNPTAALGQMAGLGELRGGILGESDQSRLTTDQLIAGGLEGNVAVQQQLSRRQRARQARYQQETGLLRGNQGQLAAVR